MSHPYPSGKLSSAESTDLAMHVAGLADAGLPLDTGLRALADELRGGRLAGVLRAMAKQLEAGATLDDAIAAQGDRLPAHLRGLVTAGVRSGRLAQVLSEFVEARRTAADLRRRALLSLA
jgi:type II secretory pathway component PulF